MEKEKLFDFSYYTRIFKSIKEWWNWNKIFFKMKRGEWKLEDSMKLADIYTKRWNKKYYVIPDPKGNPIVLNSLEFEYYKRKGIFNKELHAFDLQKDCYYQTYPKHDINKTVKKPVGKIKPILAVGINKLPKNYKLRNGDGGYDNSGQVFVFFNGEWK